MEENLIGIKVPIQKIDLKSNKPLGDKYGVKSAPILLKLNDDGIEIDRFIGVKTLAELKTFLEI
jgi:hypothetical protein